MEEAHAPHWKRTLIVTAIAQVLSIVGFNFVVPFLPLYVEQLGVHGVAQVTLWAAFLSGGSAIFMAVTAPIWGALADRHGRKIMVVRAACSAGIILAVMGLVQNVYQLLALRMVQGMFTGTVSASQALVSSQAPRRRMGFTLGVMQTALYVGTSIGPLVGGVVADQVGFRPSFGVAGVILFAAGLLVGFMVREEVRPERRTSSPAFWRDLGSAFKIPALLAMIGTYFAVQFGTTVVFPILPQFVQMLQGPGGHAVSVTGLILAGTGVAGAFSAVVTGLVSDRIGYRTVLISASIAAAVLSVPQYFVTATWELFVLRVLIGVAMGAIMPSAAALTASLVPASKRGTAYGLTGSATSIGLALGPLTAAGVVAVGGIRPVFLTAAVLLVGIAIWVALMVQEPEEEPLPEPTQIVAETIREREGELVGEHD